MAGASYSILDEPQPGTLARFVVNPFWPLLAMMMVGTWLAGPWFILNAFALGSATRKSETWLVIGSVLTTIGFIVGLSVLGDMGLLPEAVRPYARIVLAVIKLGFAYVVFTRQERSLALYEYYGGATRNGALVLVGGVIARGALSGAPAWVQWLFVI
jgi:hypothetical protein